MSSIDWDALAAREPSPMKSKGEELLSQWKKIVDCVAAEVMCCPEDKEGLEDDMRLWVCKWDGLMVHEACFPGLCADDL